jgi:hypothetical protein
LQPKIKESKGTMGTFDNNLKDGWTPAPTVQVKERHSISDGYGYY